MTPSHIEHIGIAVTNLDEAIRYWEDVMGLKCYAIEEVTDQSIKEDLWQTGWLIYYHKGKTDPDYAVLKFTSTKIEGWYNANPHILGNKG